MNLGLTPLLERLSAHAADVYVLATVIETEGSSYRKSGAMMLLAADGPVGLVSGGCLEGDLAEHAKTVTASGVSKIVTYDLSRDDDALWGLGLGCGGKIRVLLECATAADGFAGLAEVAAFWRGGDFCWLLKCCDESAAAGAQRYAVVAQDQSLPEHFGGTSLAERARDRAQRLGDDNAHLLIPVNPPPRLLVCGAGPDSLPLVRLAVASGWRVDVVDHRPAFARADRFGAGAGVVCTALEELPARTCYRRANAAVVMTHHVQFDAGYVRALAASDAVYVGVLGPAERRRQIFALANVDYGPRFFGPAGLDIGADLPETIALSILAEAQAVVSSRGGGRLSMND